MSVRRKGDPEKVRLARFLRQKTTMTLGAVAERLQMGTGLQGGHAVWCSADANERRPRAGRHPGPGSEENMHLIIWPGS